ncbi:SRPBCC domain-containing protein [Nocardia brasiliensis]
MPTIGPRTDRSILGSSKCFRPAGRRHLEHRHVDGGLVEGIGRILEIDPPRRLVHTWAAPSDHDRPERHSTVTFDLEPIGEAVRLTVTHENLPPEYSTCTDDGWPMVLSSLESWLETGWPLSSLWRGQEQP